MPLKVQDAGPTFESGRKRLLLVLAGVMVVVLALGAKSGAVQRAWQILVGERLPVDAPEPVAASRPQLSEHEREWIRQQEPQAQAMALMKAAINHEEGATELIAQSLDQWQGKLQNSSEWTNLMMLALYSNDLRVRAAAIEINLSANNIYKTSDGAESII